ncbi:hypothetical protein [Mucilaginibacter sp.]|jgi:hypothetical protein|uniref:hypothetical protein n=1 Tax=Mucilaginibacter sp. TaxID=1882438 RepID=UPI003561FEDC
MKNLETFEAAAVSQNIDPNVLPGITGLPEGMSKAIIAAYKLFVINQAAWACVVIDWDNYEQRKYYPWFDLQSGFSFDVCDYAYSYSNVGSRLCYPTREIAEYVGKTHIELYKDLMAI